MKNLEEMYKEILADPELKSQCAEALKAGKLEEFLKEQDCEATLEEVKTFWESRKEVSPDELDILAGGCDTHEALISAFTFGIGCIGVAVASLTRHEEMRYGHLLCNPI